MTQEREVTINELQLKAENGDLCKMVLRQHEQLQAVIKERDELKEKVESLKKEKE